MYEQAWAAWGRKWNEMMSVGKTRETESKRLVPTDKIA